MTGGACTLAVPPIDVSLKKPHYAYKLWYSPSTSMTLLYLPHYHFSFTPPLTSVLQVLPLLLLLPLQPLPELPRPLLLLLQLPLQQQSALRLLELQQLLAEVLSSPPYLCHDLSSRIFISVQHHPPEQWWM